jgi:hypothetical protein
MGLSYAGVHEQVAALVGSAVIWGAACVDDGLAHERMIPPGHDGYAVQAAGGFDWRGDCSSGTGSFEQVVPYGRAVEVGEIPRRKLGIRIDLTAPVDIDVQLVDVEGNAEIVGWPAGLISGPGRECAEYEAVTYCYSGYAGDGAGGREWIEVKGATNRRLLVRAFGYAEGTAQITYQWAAVDTCDEQGDGRFEQTISRRTSVAVGDIPAGKTNALVRLSSANDLDVQLHDGPTAIVRWPDGILNGPWEQSIEYAGMKVTWSGYRGDGNGLGHEFIRVDGVVSRALSVRAYGYQAGAAQVEYQWGLGTGVECGLPGLAPCAAGLVCKGGDSASAVAGACHTRTWCKSAATARVDCAGLPKPLLFGYWSCSDRFQCVWK